MSPETFGNGVRTGSTPRSTGAGHDVAALIELVDYRALTALYRASSARLAKIYGFAARADFLAAVAALLGVLVFDTLTGLVIGIVDSLLLLLYRVSRPHIVAVLGQIPGSGGQWADTAAHPEDQTVPGITVPRRGGRVLRQRRPRARDDRGRRRRRRRHSRRGDGA